MSITYAQLNNTFACTANGSVDIDVSGLGHTNLCLVGSIDATLNCACAGGGNCTSDAKKASVETTITPAILLQSKNGHVNTTVPVTLPGVDCSELLDCPSGQTARLISDTFDATWTLCVSDTCTATTCAEAEASAQLGTLENGSCDSGAVLFTGKHSSCLNLF
jgi:hypothetical protein